MARLQNLAGRTFLLVLILGAVPVLGQDTASIATHPCQSQYLQDTPLVSAQNAQNFRTVPYNVDPDVQGLLTQALRNEVQLRRADVFWQKRRMYAENRALEKQQKMRTNEDVARLREHYAAAAELLEENWQAAQRMSKQPQLRTARPRASLYNPATGAIQWPTALDNQRFTDDRALVDAHFAARNAEGGVASNAGEVKSTTERMRENLMQLVRQGEVDVRDYLAAKKFLTGVVNEARFAREPLVANLAKN